jgi:hypothetical protein
MCTMVPTRPIGRVSIGRSDGSTRDRRFRGMVVMSAIVSRSFGDMGFDREVYLLSSLISVRVVGDRSKVWVRAWNEPLWLKSRPYR